MEGNKNNLSRRAFMGAAAGTGAAALVGGPLAASATAGGRGRGHDRGRGHGNRLVPRGRLGIQTFTVRDRDDDFPALFEALASYGYEEIELFGGFDAAEVRQALDDNGLRAVGRHVGYGTFLNNIEAVLDDAEILGLPYVGTANNPGRYGDTVAGYQQAAEDFNNFGAAAKARGIKWYQHNHDGEFAFADDNPGVRLYDVLLAETDPDLVYLQMDVFWAYAGQYQYSSRIDENGDLVLAPFDPLDYVLAQPDRYPLFHIKDGVYNTDTSRGLSFTDVGDGNLKYERFINAVEDANSHGRGRRGSRYHHYIVERDDAPNVEPDPPGSLLTAQRSAEFLLSLKDTGRPVY